MLAVWPLVSILLFRTLSVERAILWCLLAGYLILPPIAAFDLPLIPSLDKHSIPALTALILCFAIAKRPLRFWSTSKMANLLIVLFVGSAIPTVLTNGDPLTAEVIKNAHPIQVDIIFQSGLSLRDMASFVLAQVIVLVPFFLGMQFFATAAAIRQLLVALIIGGLVYSIPALIEIRFSPQMNIWVYGFFQHDFLQMIRGDGFRPIVFLQHALWVALYMATAAIAAASLARYSPSPKDRGRFAIAMVYLFAVLILCKSLASQLYGLCFVGIVLVMPQRWQFRLALGLVLIGVVYPMLRNLELIPLEAILGWANEISPARAESLEYRITNEAILMDRAHEKPWFGWGGWGRNLILDPESGAIETIPDGRWIIVFGTFGWVGYLAEMGLLAYPLILLWRRTSSLNPAPPQVTALTLIVATTMLDMLLNATLTTLTWLSAGALLGYAERLKTKQDDANSDPKTTPRTAMEAGPESDQTRALM
ncbi:MAG: hypothetical protein ACU0AZ_08410 [Paracoccaceae bacterium]